MCLTGPPCNERCQSQLLLRRVLMTELSVADSEFLLACWAAGASMRQLISVAERCLGFAYFYHGTDYAEQGNVLMEIAGSKTQHRVPRSGETLWDKPDYVFWATIRDIAENYEHQRASLGMKGILEFDKLRL